MSRKKLHPNWCALNEDKSPKTGILVLPGRAGFGEDLTYRYAGTELTESLFVGITPKGFEWYPCPNGPDDQQEALDGIWAAFQTIDKTLDRIEHRYEIPRENMAVAGFSAGGVMTIQTVALSDRPLAAGIVHAGAILDPDSLPTAKHATPLLVFHNVDDSCFDWYERYIPMKIALKEKGYKTYFVEKERGNHQILFHDIIIAGFFLSKIFGYDQQWKHGRIKYIPEQIRKWKIPTMAKV